MMAIDAISVFKGKVIIKVIQLPLRQNDVLRFTSTIDVREMRDDRPDD